MFRDYAPKGVKFYYAYKTLAHPGFDGYIEPFTLKERLAHVTEFGRIRGSKIPWIVDQMDNRLKHAMGNQPNSEFVIDPQGKVIRKESWSDPNDLRKFLVELIGPVDNSTTVEQLGLRTAQPPRFAERGVVPAIDRPARMRVIAVVPTVEAAKQPFYAKLRAEAEPSVLETGTGKIYLSLRLDPLYPVHWNNLMPPMRVEFAAPPGTTVTPAVMHGPKVDEDSDSDPREFLIEVKNWNLLQSPTVKVAYYACNDKEGWCKLIEQQYRLFRIINRDAGKPP